MANSSAYGCSNILTVLDKKFNKLFCIFSLIKSVSKIGEQEGRTSPVGGENIFDIL
jgi:hypothetical protein